MDLRRLIGSIIGALACVAGHASVCTPASMSERAFVGLGRNQGAVVPGAAVDAVAVEELTLRLRLRSWEDATTSTRQVVRLVHDYGAHRIDARVPMPTNGHLHRLGIEWRRHSPSWEIAAAPVLAASSNIGRHPRALDAGMVDWHASMRRVEQLSPSLAVLFGICRDDRRGETRVAPSLAIRWQPQESTELMLGYPDSRLVHRLSPALRFGLSLSPSGGSWQVFDKELTHQSRFSRQGWRLEAGLGLHLPWRQEVAVAIGIERRRALEFDSPPGVRMSTDISGTTYLALRWRR